MSKRWGVALKKNVVADEIYMVGTNKTKHDSSWPIKAATVFRKFETRSEAREFMRSRSGNPTYLVDLDSGVVTR